MRAERWQGNVKLWRQTMRSKSRYGTSSKEIEAGRRRTKWEVQEAVLGRISLDFHGEVNRQHRDIAEIDESGCVEMTSSPQPLHVTSTASRKHSSTTQRGSALWSHGILAMRKRWWARVDTHCTPVLFSLRRRLWVGRKQDDHNGTRDTQAAVASSRREHECWISLLARHQSAPSWTTTDGTRTGHRGRGPR